MLSVIFVEILNLAILLTNETILDIVENFLTIVILTEFDNFFAATMT